MYNPTDLAQFTGTENWHRHGLARNVLYTDGAKYVADEAKAHWLLDVIAFAQLNAKLQKEHFQVWKLDVKDTRAELITTDGNDRILLKQSIPYTDFPAEGVTLWVEDGGPEGRVILLPSEH